MKRFGFIPFPTSTFNFIDLRNERISPFNVRFSCYNTYYFLYTNFTKYQSAKRKSRKREREREREREPNMKSEKIV